MPNRMNATKGFGDDDPEDAYDAGDPFPERLRIVAATVGSIVATADPGTARHAARHAWAHRAIARLDADGADPDVIDAWRDALDGVEP